MPLFHEKIIAKALGGDLSPVPDSHLEILQSWKERIESGALLKQTEVAIHAPFTQNIMAKVLGYKPFGKEENWTISREYGVAGGAVDLALGLFSDDKTKDVVIAPFESIGWPCVITVIRSVDEGTGILLAIPSEVLLRKLDLA